MSALLITAATRWEAEPLAKILGLRRDGAKTFAGERGGRRVILLRTGIGPLACARTLAELGEPFVAALSAGYAGALSENLRCGDVVADLPDSDLGLRAALRRAAADASVVYGRIADSSRVLGSPSAKRELGRRTGACAVDMETQTLRTWAAPMRIAVGAIRVVLDEMDESLPEEIPGDGDLAALAVYALKNPGQWPAMAVMALRQRRLMPRYARLWAALLDSWTPAETLEVL